MRIMKKIIIATVSLLALIAVVAMQPAQTNNQSTLAGGDGCTNKVNLTSIGCTNHFSTTLACGGGCTNGVTLASLGCTNHLALAGCTNSLGITLALASY